MLCAWVCNDAADASEKDWSKSVASVAEAALQQEYLRRRKMNTYKVHWGNHSFGVLHPLHRLSDQERRKEGRTVHTKASRTAIIVASLSLFASEFSPACVSEIRVLRTSNNCFLQDIQSHVHCSTQLAI